MVSFPYYSHIFRDSYGSGMGIVWDAYHKGVPLLGVPENPTEIWDTPLPMFNRHQRDGFTPKKCQKTCVVFVSPSI